MELSGHRWLKAACALVALSSSAVLLFGFWAFPRLPVTAVAPEERFVHRIVGMRYTDWEDGRRHLTISIDELIVEEQAYLAFKLRFVHQAVMKNTHFQLFSDKDRKYARDSFSFANTLQGLPAPATHSEQTNVTHGGKSVRISRAIMAPFQFTVEHEQKVTLRCQAELGEWKAGVKKIRFMNVVLENRADNKTIFTRVAYWNETSHSFEIPGSYHAVTPKGQADGQGLQVGLDFALTPLP